MVFNTFLKVSVSFYFGHSVFLQETWRNIPERCHLILVAVRTLNLKQYISQYMNVLKCLFMQLYVYMFASNSALPWSLEVPLTLNYIPCTL
jgi:hypothetical protein